MQHSPSNIVKSSSYGLLGITPFPVHIEVAPGPFSVQTDLPRSAGSDALAKEIKLRVSSALQQLGVSVREVGGAVTIRTGGLSLSSGGWDLAVAVAVAAHLGAIPRESLADKVFMAELSVAGLLHPVRGVFPCARQARLAGKKFVGSIRNSGEMVPTMDRAANTLSDVLAWLRGEPMFLEPLPAAPRANVPSPTIAAEKIAALPKSIVVLAEFGDGMHGVARAIAESLPDLSLADSVLATSIYSAAGLLQSTGGMLTRPPLRAPHHTVSEAGLLGGGLQMRPGEVSLATCGVLVLDQIDEFRRSTLEALLHATKAGFVEALRQGGDLSVRLPAAPRLTLGIAYSKRALDKRHGALMSSAEFKAMLGA
jgi:magnesium chelatase family protein